MKRLGALLLGMMLTSAARAEPLQIATDGWHPVAYLENGHPAGALCDVLTEAARRAGLSIEFHLQPWARGMAETQAGRIDAIFPAFRTPERESILAFPGEILLEENVTWFVRADSPIEIGPDLAGARGHRIALVNRTSLGAHFDQALRNGMLTNVEAVPDTTSAVRTLTGGRVELIAGFDQGIWAEAEQLGLKDQLRELKPAIEAVPAYLAFTRARDLSAESQAIDAALKSMKEDGTYQKILARYFTF